MQYFVTRNGQTYGPYTLEDLQRYVASGHVLLTDLARPEAGSAEDATAPAIPVAEILRGSGASAAAPYPPAQPFADPAQPFSGAAVPGQPYGAPAVPLSASPYPPPPDLHWGLVLLFGLFTCGVFIIIWDIVQSLWLRRVLPSSRALFIYLAAVACYLLYFATSVGTFVALTHGAPAHTNPVGAIFNLIYLVLVITARFVMRSDLLEFYNTVEPIGLTLSGVMTFFFGGLYFQYHFNRINQLRRSMFYAGQYPRL